MKKWIAISITLPGLILFSLANYFFFRAEIYYVYGTRLMELGKEEPAIAYFEDALATDPLNSEYARKVARTCMEIYKPGSGNLRPLYQAKNAADKAIASDPLYPYNWFEMGKALWAMNKAGVKDQGSPEPYLLKAIEIDPNNPLFLEGIVKYLVENGDNQRSWELFIRLTQINPSFMEKMAGIFFDKEGRLEEYAAITKGKPRMTYVLVRYLLNRRMNHLAAEQIMALPEKSLENRDMAFLAATALSRAGMADQACPVLERAYDSNPQHPQLALRAASIYSQYKQWDKGVKILEKAAASNPSDTEIWLKLAQSAEKSGAADKAIQAYTKVLSLRSVEGLQLKKVHVALGDLLNERGSAKDALSHYRIALELDPEDQGLRRKAVRLEVEIELEARKNEERHRSP